MTNDEIEWGDFSIITSSTQTGDINTTRLYINPLGNISIGTLSGSGNRIVVANSGGTLVSAVIGSGLAFDGTTLTATGGSSGSISGSGTSGTIALFTGATSIGNSLITQSSSNLGIGNATPATRLQIDSISATSSSTVLTINGSATGFLGSNDANTGYSINFDGCAFSSPSGIVQRTGAQIEMLKSGSWNQADTGGGTLGNLIFKTNSGNIASPNLSERMRITSGGNVLINTTSDNGNRLRVNGTIFSDSSVTATSFFESSDATLKTLVEDDYQAKGIDSVVAKLYIKNGKQELGYFAQDLEGVLPSAVNKGSDGLLNLSYREVHTAKIAYLEEEIRQIKKRYEIN
jgi:hypothetical protein